MTLSHDRPTNPRSTVTTKPRGNRRKGNPELRTNAARREHKILHACGDWSDDYLVTLTSPPGKPRGLKWFKNCWRATIDAVQPDPEQLDSTLHFALCVNRGVKGTNDYASGHVVLETDHACPDLVSRLKRHWNLHYGKLKKTSSGGKATVYWANNAAQKDAEKVYWMAAVWSDKPPADLLNVKQRSHKRPMTGVAKAALEDDWLSENNLTTPQRVEKRARTIAELEEGIRLQKEKLR